MRLNVLNNTSLLVSLFLEFYFFVIFDCVLVFLTEKPRVLLTSGSGYQNGYGLTVFEDYIYAAFSMSKEIIRLNKTSGKNQMKFFSAKSLVRGATSVFAYDKSLQPQGGPCAKHDCEQLCLPYGETKYRYYIYSTLLRL